MARTVKRTTPVRSVEERNRLVDQWQFLPLHVYQKLKHIPQIRGYGMDDCLQAGRLGLIHAADLWDENRVSKEGKKAQFQTYAFTAIRNHIMQAAMDDTPIHIRRGAWTSNDPKIQEMLAIVRRTLRLEELKTKHGNPFRNYIVEKTDETWSPKDHEAIGVWVDTLEERTKWVIYQRFWHDSTYAAMSKELGITKEAVRLIVKRTLKQLRGYWENGKRA